MSQNLFNKFNEWHKKWLESNTSSEQQMKTQEWLVSSDTSAMATISDSSKPSVVSTDKPIVPKIIPTVAKQTPSSDKKLIKLIINNEERPPYRKFCRYKIELQ